MKRNKVLIDGIIYIHKLGELILFFLKNHGTQGDIKIQCHLLQISHDIFHGNRKLVLYFMTNYKDSKWVRES